MGHLPRCCSLLVFCSLGQCLVDSIAAPLSVGVFSFKFRSISLQISLMRFIKNASGCYLFPSLLWLWEGARTIVLSLLPLSRFGDSIIDFSFVLNVFRVLRNQVSLQLFLVFLPSFFLLFFCHDVIRLLSFIS